MYKGEYKKLFWGFLIVLLDFRLGSLNLLPDFIGYGVIVSALSGLIDETPFYKKARLWAMPLIVITLPETIIKGGNLLEGFSLSGFGIGFLILLISQNTLSLVLAYYIFEGLLQVSKQRGFDALYQRTKTTMYFYLLINFLWLVVLPFSFNFDQPLLYGGVGIGVFIVQIYFIVLIKSFDKEQSIRVD